MDEYEGPRTKGGGVVRGNMDRRRWVVRGAHASRVLMRASRPNLGIRSGRRDAGRSTRDACAPRTIWPQWVIRIVSKLGATEFLWPIGRGFSGAIGFSR